jgi:hypothetical protein
LAGLAVTYGLKINILQAWVIWNACNVENKMISVERIILFSCIPSEAPSVLKDRSPEPKWAETGCIEIRNLEVLYDPALPPVTQGNKLHFTWTEENGNCGKNWKWKINSNSSSIRLVEPS